MTSDSLPHELRTAIAQARAELDGSTDGAILLPARRRISACFGTGPVFQQRRFALGRLCAEHVLDRWDRVRPDDRRPHEAIALAERALRGDIDVATAQEAFGRFETAVEDLTADGLPADADLAASAANKLVLTAITEDDYEDDDPPEQTEYEQDYYSWDIPYRASQAAARVIVGAKFDWDPDARRAFWRWYLDEAVPAAYAAGDS
jgi:hypothetical protein